MELKLAALLLGCVWAKLEYVYRPEESHIELVNAADNLRRREFFIFIYLFIYLFIELVAVETALLKPFFTYCALLA
jgi:hypothetical protein